jgi:hypothetical protein
MPNGNFKTVTEVLPAIRLEKRTGKLTWLFFLLLLLFFKYNQLNLILKRFNSIVAAYFGYLNIIFNF